MRICDIRFCVYIYDVCVYVRVYVRVCARARLFLN
jgi:hypothetical protein